MHPNEVTIDCLWHWQYVARQLSTAHEEAVLLQTLRQSGTSEELLDLLLLKSVTRLTNTQKARLLELSAS